MTPRDRAELVRLRRDHDLLRATLDAVVDHLGLDVDLLRAMRSPAVLAGTPSTWIEAAALAILEEANA